MLPRIKHRKQKQAAGIRSGCLAFCAAGIAAATQENEFISIMDNGSGARLPGSREKGKAFIYIMSGNPCQEKQFDQREKRAEETEPAEICQVIYFMRPRTITR